LAVREGVARLIFETLNESSRISAFLEMSGFTKVADSQENTWPVRLRSRLDKTRIRFQKNMG